MQKFYTINKIDREKAEILVYGYIGFDDVTASEFVKELKELEKTSSKINIRINSGGGSIFEGLAIFNAIRNSQADITAYIDGIAASMGSVIAMAPKKVMMSKSAVFMTHRASGMAIGNANALRNYASMMESLEKTICTIYASKTGLTEEEAKTKYLGTEDKWMTADEALAEKIIDGIYDAPAVAAPKNITNEKELVGYYNAAMKIQTTTMDKITLSIEQITKLGLPANADATAFAVALDELINKAGKVDAAETAKQTAETTLAEFKKTTVTAEVKNLLDTALNVDKKITVEVKNELQATYGENPTALKSLLDKLPAFVSLAAQLKTGAEAVKALADLSYQELDTTGKLEELKAKDLDTFKAKYKERYGVEYTGK